MIPFRINDLKEHTKKVTFIRVYIAIALVFSMNSCSSNRNINSSEDKNQAWALVKASKNDESNWIIHTRKLVGTNFIEYKIEGAINSTPQDCVSSFKQDIHNHADDLKNKKYPIYEIIDESKESLLTYVIHNEPFPFKDTEMSVRYHFSKDIESTATEIKWEEAWDEYSVPPPSKKLSRVQTFRGSWHFSLNADNHSQSINTVRFDPKKMPHWLVSKMVTKFLIKGLENLRKMTSKENKTVSL